MKTDEKVIEPGETYKSVLADALEIDEECLMGILPVNRYVSINTEQGIVLAFAGVETGMSFLIPHSEVTEISRILLEALKDGTN